MMVVVVGLVLVMVWTGSYRSVERIAFAFGLFELAFVAVAFCSHPSLTAIAAQIKQAPLGHSKYLYLVAANLGAVIIPWMIFYQQSAVLDKGLTPADLKAARWDTAIGAIVTQLIMASVLIAEPCGRSGRIPDQLWFGPGSDRQRVPHPTQRAPQASACECAYFRVLHEP
jgi:Mn2+/Fe2+ NRAMP family transporter